eukprot:scaffold203019_cov15-Prasinocladus_malaysianus.AAC.1
MFKPFLVPTNLGFKIRDGFRGGAPYLPRLQLCRHEDRGQKICSERKYFAGRLGLSGSQGRGNMNFYPCYNKARSNDAGSSQPPTALRASRAQ